ncbi:MAG: ABC transporter ATP-binding protein [Alphaproteobacteria bacterium]
MTEAPHENPPLLAVDDLSVAFRTRGGEVRALEHVSFAVRRGETLGIVGESGSGKSVTAQAVMGILDAAGRVTAGSIVFGGMDLLTAKPRELADMRGRELAMIFQNPRGALNPIRKVGDQIADVLARHANLKPGPARERAMEMLALVKITDPKRRLDAYPFELSGGMCQRVMIALALSCRPALLIADEPTTGLDVTTQAAIMDLVGELGRSRGMATILITHDLGLAAEHCRRIVVMHAGHVVEDAPTEALFRSPRHPYTARLLAATPRPGRSLESLASIPGGLPDLRRSDLPGCRFVERCALAETPCRAPTLAPAERATQAGPHRVLCARPLA